MLGRKKSKQPHGLYYLLPGMNRGNRRRRKYFFLASVAVGIVVAALVGVALYVVNKR